MHMPVLEERPEARGLYPAAARGSQNAPSSEGSEAHGLCRAVAQIGEGFPACAYAQPWREKERLEKGKSTFAQWIAC